MKSILIISITFLLQFQLCGQIIEGTYTADQEYFVITKDSISFEIEISAFRMVSRGIGAYELIDNFLIVETTNFPGLKSHVADSIVSDSENIKVHIKLSSVYPNVFGKDINGEIVKRFQINENGDFTIDPNDNIETVVFSTIGFDPLTTRFQQGFDYRVNLAEGVTVENQNVVFVINDIDKKTIGLTLLDIKAENEQITSAKTLSKLKRKKGKNSFWTRTLTRKYTP